MADHDAAALLNLYLQIAPAELLRLLQRQAGKIVRNGIYSARLVIWMMIDQRLHAGATLAVSVDHLVQGRFDALLSRCKRTQERRIALSTGGYCQARKKLPKILVSRTVDELIERLRERICADAPDGQPRFYVLDGSSIQLEHSPDLIRHYPQAENGKGKAHRPVLRVVVLHDVESGLAERPYSGPMYGANAVSEQALAREATAHLPAGSVIIADRNFGIFSTVYHAHDHKHGLIVRMTDVRAKALVGQPISCAGEYGVEWRASARDRKNHPDLPPQASVAGRLIAIQVGRGKHKQWLYLFTTLSLPAKEVVDWYGKRWRIETDLRSLKQTVRLNHLNIKSSDLAEKELLVAVLAYNLVRTLMYLAAERSAIDPRQLSFTNACNVVLAGYPRILAARGEKRQQQELNRIIELVGRCKLPNRKKRRSYPRAVWGHGFRFPFRKEEQN